MKTTVKALLDMYVKLGGSLTDTYADIDNGASVGSYTTIPDCIEACAKKANSGGGGGGGGGEIETVEKPSDLPSTVDNGTVMVALTDDTEMRAVTIPTQTADEEVQVNIASKALATAAPASYSADAVTAILTAVDISANGALTNGTDTVLNLGFIPVVESLANNDYVTAGISLNEDNALVVKSCTKDYAILASWNPFEFGNPAYFVDVDKDYIQVPAYAFYAFEELTIEESTTLQAGWNVALCTIDKATQEHIVDTTFTPNAVVSDYVILPDLATDELEFSGTGASMIFPGIILAAEPTAYAGLYVRLSDTWKRCTLDS